MIELPITSMPGLQKLCRFLETIRVITLKPLEKYIETIPINEALPEFQSLVTKLNAGTEINKKVTFLHLNILSKSFPTRKQRRCLS